MSSSISFKSSGTSSKDKISTKQINQGNDTEKQTIWKKLFPFFYRTSSSQNKDHTVRSNTKSTSNKGFWKSFFSCFSCFYKTRNQKEVSQETPELSSFSHQSQSFSSRVSPKNSYNLRSPKTLDKELEQLRNKTPEQCVSYIKSIVLAVRDDRLSLAELEKALLSLGSEQLAAVFTSNDEVFEKCLFDELLLFGDPSRSWNLDSSEKFTKLVNTLAKAKSPQGLEKFLSLKGVRGRFLKSLSSENGPRLSSKALALLMVYITLNKQSDLYYEYFYALKNITATTLGCLSEQEFTQLFNEFLSLDTGEAFFTLFSFPYLYLFSDKRQSIKGFEKQLEDFLAKQSLTKWTSIYKKLSSHGRSHGRFFHYLLTPHPSKDDSKVSRFINALKQDDKQDDFTTIFYNLIWDAAIVDNVIWVADLVGRFLSLQSPENLKKFFGSLDGHDKGELFELLVKMPGEEKKFLKEFLSFEGGLAAVLKEIQSSFTPYKYGKLLSSPEVRALLKQEALDTIRKLKSSLLEGLKKDIMKFLIPDDFENLETILKLSESQEEVPQELLSTVQRFVPFKGILESLKYASTLFSMLPIEDSFSTLLQEFEELISLKVEDKHIEKYLNGDNKESYKAILQKNLDRAVDALLISFSKRLDPKKQIALLSHKFPENISREMRTRFEEIVCRGVFKLESKELNSLFFKLSEANDVALMQKLFSARITVSVLDQVRGYKDVEETLSTEQKVGVLRFFAFSSYFYKYKKEMKLFIKQQIQALPEEERQNFLEQINDRMGIFRDLYDYVMERSQLEK